MVEKRKKEREKDVLSETVGCVDTSGSRFSALDLTCRIEGSQNSLNICFYSTRQSILHSITSIPKNKKKESILYYYTNFKLLYKRT